MANHLENILDLLEKTNLSSSQLMQAEELLSSATEAQLDELDALFKEDINLAELFVANALEKVRIVAAADNEGWSKLLDQEEALLQRTLLAQA